MPQGSPHSCLGLEKPKGLVLGPERQRSRRRRGCFETELVKPSLAPSLPMEWLLGWEMSLRLENVPLGEQSRALALLVPSKTSPQGDHSHG